MAKQHTLITLYYAIMTNTEVLVESYLESGEDPSVDLSPAVPTLNNILELETDDELGMLDRHILLAHHSFSRSSSVSPLHVAVVQCYKTALNSETRRSAMNILKTLLEAGAKTSIKATCNLVVCHKSWLSLTKGTIAPMIPCALAEFLKEDNFNQEDGRLRRHTLDEVIQLLQAASSKTYFAYSTPPSVTLPLSVSKTWKTLLFSEKFSDVKFKCQDGTTFHAHRNILAAASPYFSTAFEGPWGKQDENGLWETSNPPCVMEAALSFIYTGEVPPGHLDEQPEVMLAVSSEYDLTELRALSEASYARSLDSDNVKRMLQISHLYGSSALKRSCFDFVVKNMAKVLRNPSMASLATEDAELWVELAAVLFPTTPFPEEQVATSVRPAYMESQPDINERMRSILVDWLVSLQFKYRFVPETLHLAINLIDRFLQLKETSRANLQSVGITSLLIAVKYKEIIYPIDLGDLVYLCSGDYTPQDIIQMEENILKTLEYKISAPSAHAFLVHFLKAADADKKTVQLSCYLLDGTLLSYNLLQYLPSQLAAAIVYIAHRTIAGDAWSPSFLKYTPYCEEEIIPVARAILNEKSSADPDLQAVDRKYSSHPYEGVISTVLQRDF